MVYVSRYDDTQYRGQIGSQKSSEIRGRFVGFAWSVGHALTFKILTDDTKKIINRSRDRLSKSGENNLKLDVEAGEVPQRVYIRSKRDSEGDNVVLPTIDVTYNPFDIDEHHEELSCRFLLEFQETGILQEKLEPKFLRIHDSPCSCTWSGSQQGPL